jgi:hypothetical protein
MKVAIPLENANNTSITAINMGDAISLKILYIKGFYGEKSVKQ